MGVGRRLDAVGVGRRCVVICNNKKKTQWNAKKRGTPPTGTGVSGNQNADTNDASTHAALHV